MSGEELVDLSSSPAAVSTVAAEVPPEPQTVNEAEIETPKLTQRKAQIMIDGQVKSTIMVPTTQRILPPSVRPGGPIPPPNVVRAINYPPITNANLVPSAANIPFMNTNPTMLTNQMPTQPMMVPLVPQQYLSNQAFYPQVPFLLPDPRIPGVQTNGVTMPVYNNQFPGHGGIYTNAAVSQNQSKVYTKEMVQSIAATHPPVLPQPPQYNAPQNNNPHVLTNPNQPPRPTHNPASAPNPYYRNLQNDQAHQQSYASVYQETLKVTFTLINATEFTARIETGHVSKDILRTIFKSPGSKFDDKLKRFVFPVTTIEILKSALAQKRCNVISIPRNILNAVLVNANANNGMNQNSEEVDNFLKGKGLPDAVLTCLAPFQREAVRFVVNKEGRALVADEMGLGKTRTAIASACIYREDWPVLVVCPSSARHHWQSEILSIIPNDILREKEVTVVDNGYHPLDSKSKEFQYKIIIISYSLVAKMHHLLATIPFNVIIANESHYIKTLQSQRSQRLVPMLKKSKRAILLSGTPALSRPFELFTQLNALDEKTWNDVRDFGRRYCQDAKPTKKKSLFNSHNRNSGWKSNTYKGSNNTRELHLLLTSTVMIRRLKNDILKQLPPKKRYLMKIAIEDTEKLKYFNAMLATLNQYEELMMKKKQIGAGRKKSRILNSDSELLLEAVLDMGDNDSAALAELKVARKRVLLELFDQSGVAKVPAVLRHLEKFLQEEFAGKILIFAHHKEVLNQLATFLRERDIGFIRIDGGTPSKDRHQLTQKFQSDSETRVAILGITAAGIALTLTAASTVFFAELYWTPGSLIQAEDRAHRIGQVRNVNVFYFFAENSVDELLWPLVRKKMKLLGEFVEGHQDGDIGATLFSGKKERQNKTSSKQISSSSEGNEMECTQEEESQDALEESTASNSQKSEGAKDIEIIEIDLDDANTASKVFGATEENEEELAELMLEIAKDASAEEKNKAEKKDQSSSSSSNKHRKAEEDDDDDEENEEEEEDVYEDYLKSVDPPDMLAQSYIAYLEGREEKIRAQQAQAMLIPAQYPLYNHGGQGSSKGDCINLIDDEEDIPQKPSSSNPISSSSAATSGNIPIPQIKKLTKAEIISLIDDDDEEEVAPPPPKPVVMPPPSNLHVKSEQGEESSQKNSNCVDLSLDDDDMDTKDTIAPSSAEASFPQQSTEMMVDNPVTDEQVENVDTDELVEEDPDNNEFEEFGFGASFG